MKEIDIGILAKQSGFSTAAIRFYENKGLIKSIGRNGLRRQYPVQTVQTLALIKRLKNGGLTLKEIQQIFIVNNKIKVDREVLDEKINTIQVKVAELGQLIETLQHIQHCPHPDHMSCPEFIKLLT